MDYKCSEENFNLCQRSNLCHLCDGERLFTKPKWMITKEKQDIKKASGVKKQKKEGMGFEKKVKKAYNKKMVKDNARRTANSGAIWCMPGDIITENELIECKERGTRNASGEKTISIPRDHLIKTKHEAYLAKKNIWYYIFQYKNTDEIYLVKDYHDELEMISQIQMLKQRVQELEDGEV